jgi:hypothetical protein
VVVVSRRKALVGHRDGGSEARGTSKMCRSKGKYKLLAWKCGLEMKSWVGPTSAVKTVILFRVLRVAGRGVDIHQSCRTKNSPSAAGHASEDLTAHDEETWPK